MSVSLFDFFGVEADLGPVRLNNEPIPIKYRGAASIVRPLINTTFEPYRTQRIDITGSRNHGTPLVESGALASVQPPMPKAQPMLEGSLISRGVLSTEQLETTIYAADQHSQFFNIQRLDMSVSPPVMMLDRYRAGYFIGDGTGVGKGRQAASIIRDNFNNGRTRAIWFSLNELLIGDARRDWLDLGGRKDDIILWSKTGLNEPLPFQYGILFGTYALLRSKSKDKETSRVDQLVAAVGEHFDGVIIFDEAHAGANADPADTDGDGNRKASQQGRAMLALQERLPNARVVYISATGASRLDALAYAPRLRLWGVGTGFASRNSFLESVTKGGTSALEVVSRYLKAAGRFCSRSLSYEGVGYERVVHELDEAQIEQYNSYIAVWRMIENGFTEELLRLGAVFAPTNGSLEVTTVSGSPMGRARSRIQSGKQRFFAHALMSIKMPTMIVKIKQELNAGNAVVLQITHTDEARLDRALSEKAEDESLDDLDLGHRDFLVQFVRKNYPIVKYRSGTTDKGDPCVYAVIDPHTEKEEIDLNAIARREELIAAIEEMVFPEGALDLLYDEFGYEAVAEVSGRSKMMLRERQLDGSRKRVLFPRSNKENQQQTDAFLDDKKQILVFTEGAGGTGRSYHAGTVFKNQRPRVHIVLEMSWRAEGAIQGLGRTHRTGQVCPPRYVFATTNVPGEKRLTSTPARRIAALGALSRGQREAADNGLFRAEDNLETPYAEAALRDLLADIAGGRVDGMDRHLFFLQTGIDAANVTVTPSSEAVWPPKKVPGNAIRMTKFLNRLMAVDIAMDGGLQQLLFDALLERIEARIDDAIAQGKYDTGVETFTPKSLEVIERETIDVDESSGAITELLRLRVQDEVSDVNTFAAALAMRDRYVRISGKNDTRFALNDAGEVELHIPVRHEEVVPNPVVRIIRPVGERSRFKNDGRAYTTLTEAQAQDAWQKTLTSLTLVTREIHVIAGALLPIWSRLPETLPTIFRMQTDAGERLLARVIPTDELASVEATFGVNIAAAA